MLRIRVTFTPNFLYRICKEHDVILKRLDYNEPQKGKDQCDRDSAVARNILRCFVDEGNDILSAEDTHKTLTTSKMANMKVSVVSLDKPSTINADGIPNISLFHSIEFCEKKRSFGATMQLDQV